MNARKMTFYDQWVCKLIVEKYGMEEMRAVREFVTSETYKMLLDPETELNTLSPYILFDLWENEKVMGDPRYSLYIRGCDEEGN